MDGALGGGGGGGGARGTSAWQVVKVVGELKAEAAGGRPTPFVSEEGRLHIHSRAELQEWPS